MFIARLVFHGLARLHIARNYRSTLVRRTEVRNILTNQSIATDLYSHNKNLRVPVLLTLLRLQGVSTNFERLAIDERLAANLVISGSNNGRHLLLVQVDRP